jgi:4-carboxymuconolactone decarboxylase
MTEPVDIRAALERLAQEQGENPLASNPQLQTYIATYLQTFIFNGSIDPLLRQRAILRIMWRLNQPYEWGNHYRIAKKAGLSDADILAVRSSDPDHAVQGPAALVVRAADEIVDIGRLTPQTMKSVEDLFVDPGIVLEFLYLVAGYRMMASVSASRGPRQIRGDIWPPDGIGPQESGPT